MKIICVEPHPDDAFLSLGYHLETLWAEHERTIITVYADSKRGKEAEEYAEVIGASSIVLGVPESKMLSEGKIRKEHALESILEGLEYDIILFPLGLQHPDHLRIAATRPLGAYRYLDTPYQSKLKLGEVLNSKSQGMVVDSIYYAPKRKWRHVPIFKSQAKFFHFVNVNELRTPEIVLRQK